MGFKPLHDWALIRRDEPEDRTSGGIIIPDTAKDKPAEGVVLAIGPGKFVKEKGKKEKKFVATVLKKGDRVMFIDYMAKDIEMGPETITLIREDDILGTLQGGRDVMVKPAYEMEAKQERPPMVQKAPTDVPPAESGKESPAGTPPRTVASAKKKAPAKRPAVKASTKAGSTKKTAQKPARRAGTASKAVAKAVKKTAKPSAGKAAKKSVKPSTATAVKKTASSKPAAKSQKPRKAAPAKAAPKKAASVKQAKKAVKVSGKKAAVRKAVKTRGRKK